MKTIVTVCFLVCVLTAQAQLQAGRQVIGSLGSPVSVSGGYQVHCTAGEAAVGTTRRNEEALTQGFHQPKTNGFLRFEVETTPASCPTSTDGTATIVSIGGCEGQYGIVWSNGTTDMSSDRFGPGNYYVTVTSGPCVEVFHFEIAAGPADECKLRFFTAFSPNGDGINDVWTIENIDRPEFSDNSIEIFNRWGQSVWKGRNYDNARVAWDGSGPGGKKLPPGTYFFVADVAGAIHKGYIEITI